MKPSPVNVPVAGRDVAPSVDVLMLAYNAAPFIEEAVSSVMQQRTDFPVRLVIAEDGSTDGTPSICERLSVAHPGRVLYLPGGKNLGVAKRTLEGLRACTARYLAICDSDDLWTDPGKLVEQIGFLERHPEHGLSYTDVSIIERDGTIAVNDAYDALRADYADGHVFVKLLQGNFINNSTTVVRRELLDALRPNACRDDLIGDHLRWLQVSIRTRVHFLPRRTTAYRRGGITSVDAQARNRRVMMEALGGLLLENARIGPSPSRAEKPILLRKTLGVLARPGTALGLNLALLLPLFRYLPGMMAGRTPRKSGPHATNNTLNIQEE